MRKEPEPSANAKPAFVARGGVWVLVQTALMLGVIAAGWVCQADWPANAWARAAGGVAIGLGAFFGLAGVAGLGSGRTVFPHPLPDASLVTTGVYGLVRHPLYASLIWLGLGWGLWRGSWAALIVTAVMALFLDAKARREERWLRQKFTGYRDYMARVKRLLPGVY